MSDATNAKYVGDMVRCKHGVFYVEPTRQVLEQQQNDRAGNSGCGLCTVSDLRKATLKTWKSENPKAFQIEDN
jgi:formate dehydrogenase assembly factor FdhD